MPPLHGFSCVKFYKSLTRYVPEIYKKTSWKKYSDIPKYELMKLVDDNDKI